jgi:hypothetical protein
MVMQFHKPRVNVIDKLLNEIIGGYDYYIIEYDDDPVIEVLGGEWTLMDNYTWLISGHLNAEEISKWFYMGNWYILAGNEKNITPLPPFEFNKINNSMFAATNAAAALIAFYDNAEIWKYTRSSQKGQSEICVAIFRNSSQFENDRS